MKKILIFLLFNLILFSSFPQNPNWYQYSAGDYVLCQAFENDDILWVGTFNGLFRFTLSTGDIVRYNTANSPLTSNNIRTLTIDDDNNKWIGTWRDGLLKYNDETWTVYDTANSGLPAMGIVDLETDSENNIWMILFDFSLSTTGSVVCFDGTEWTTYNSQNSGIPGTSYHCLNIDSGDTVWIGSGYWGVIKFDGLTWTVFNEANSELPDDHIYSIYIDPDNTKWIGTSEGMAGFNGNDWTVFTTLSGLPYPVVKSINRDQNKTLWISSNTFNSGGISNHCLVSRDTNDVWTVYNQENSGLPDNAITDILIKNNTKWIGTYNGIAGFDDTTWEVVELGSGLPDDQVTSIASGNSGIIWSVSASGLTKYDGTNWQTYNSGNSLLPVDQIYKIVVLADDVLYVCTRGGGLVAIDNGNWTIFNTGNGDLPNDTVYCCTLDQDNNLWIGTNYGIAKYTGFNWTDFYYTGNSGLPFNEIKAIAVDHDGVVWLSSDGLIVSFDGNNWTVHDFTTGTPVYYDVISIAVDLDNVKWFGTFQYGILSFDGTAWDDYPYLPACFAKTIEVDDDNVKWFGALGGMVAFTNPDIYKTYTVYNSGLSGKDVYAITIDTNNTKWIGTRDNGISAFNEYGISVSTPEKGFSKDNRINMISCPNPFGSSTTLHFNLPENSKIEVDIHNLEGVRVNRLFDGMINRGSHKITWNGTDINGTALPRGIYIVSIKAENKSVSSVRVVKY